MKARQTARSGADQQMYVLEQGSELVQQEGAMGSSGTKDGLPMARLAAGRGEWEEIGRVEDARFAQRRDRESVSDKGPPPAYTA